MTKIRLQRLGRRNRPAYRFVVSDARCKRQGKYLEALGEYDPLKKDAGQKIQVDLERVKHWVSQGAQVSEAAGDLLRLAGLNLNQQRAEKRAAEKSREKKAAPARPKPSPSASPPPPPPPAG